MSNACRYLIAFAGAALLLSIFGAGCAGDRTRTGATCDPACGGFQECCSSADGTATCRAVANDPRNCGGCGIECSSGVCRSGTCVAGGDGGPGVDGGPTGDCRPTCSSAQRCCGTTCVNRNVTAGADGRSDPSFENCNGCGLTCDPERASACSPPPGGGAPRCMCGAFGQCPATDVCVTGSTGTFQCVNLSTDKNNCGEAGNVCPGDEICSGGTCVCGSGGACGDGQTCCGSTCINTSDDPSNCGGCGNSCASLGGDSCVAGACRCGSGPGCTPASGTDLGQLCCTGSCVAQDQYNCGGCGTSCDGSDTCVLGTDLGGTGSSICCAPAGFPFCIGFGTGDGGFPFPFP